VAYEIPDFRKGKQVTNGRPTPTPSFRVTVVHRDEALEFFRAPNKQQLRGHLKGLRDLGLLVHDKQRLTQTVRVGDRGRDRGRIGAYVVKGPIRDVPRMKDRQRVGTW
jgi:hypothetical protein